MEFIRAAPIIFTYDWDRWHMSAGLFYEPGVMWTGIVGQKL